MARCGSMCPAAMSRAMPPDQIIAVPFQGAAGAAGFRVAIFDEGPTPGQAATNPQTILGLCQRSCRFARFVFVHLPSAADKRHRTSFRLDCK